MAGPGIEPETFYMCGNVLTRSTAPVRKLVLPPYYPLVVLMLYALSSSSGENSRLLCSHNTNRPPQGKRPLLKATVLVPRFSYFLFNLLILFERENIGPYVLHAIYS